MIRKSIAQDFFLLAVGENGGMAPLRREVSNAGLVAAGVLDLEAAGVIASEKKLGGGAVSALDTGLLLLLKESKNLGQYFSKFEDGERKARLKDLRKNPRNEKVAAAVKEAEDLMKAAAACLSSYGG